MKTTDARGFTLIELMIAVVIVGILVGIAFPNYRQYVVRSSRTAAQTELLELSSMQEKIYLNSNAFSGSITAAYDGTSSGGLGRTTGKTNDGKYTLSITPTTPGQSYTITATPVAGSTQENDGAFSISSNGTRSCGTPAPSWCTNSSW